MDYRWIISNANLYMHVYVYRESEFDKKACQSTQDELITAVCFVMNS